MAQRNEAELANHEDYQEIAALLEEALPDPQIQVKVQRRQSCLRVLLEGHQIPEQAAVIACIRQTLEPGQPKGVTQIEIYARYLGATQLAWRKMLTLPPVLDSPFADEFQTEGTQRQAAAFSEVKAVPERSRRLSPRAIHSSGWGALGTGLILAILLIISPLKLLFTGFLVMVHELGHAVTHWLFGRPALPTVNLLYGGGITLVFEQSPAVIGLIYFGFAVFAYGCRAYPRLLGVLAGLAILYTLCLRTSTNTMLSTFMGHGMELVAIALCLYFSASGYICRVVGDRSIYAMLGFFTWFYDIQFSWKLIHDEDFRAFYEGGIGGVLDNDFVVLATEHFQTNLSAIAQWFLISCILAPVVAFLALRYESWLKRGLHALVQHPD
ncbi:hypothetical protein JOY44_09265 [Phormidium sp. CLA17]|uniref:hypothetical protein n=1 Tax=Leptolyngbya sp. Cla-17 TaxID=2803751 RepID=UPI00193332FE|nr:hypothetical protein [Leptolyngbya sp. Cla-17]MBM0741807.1 hypothetical protein [Leptolyngbya sp. Cla-17]